MYTSCSYCVPDRPVDWSVSQSPPNHMIARNWHSVADTFSDCTADGPADNGICKKKNFLHSPSSVAAAVAAPKNPFLLLSPGASLSLIVHRFLYLHYKSMRADHHQQTCAASFLFYIPDHYPVEY